jgi:hypothetical protein
MKVFEDTTGRHAIWHGRITKIYLNWKKRQKNVSTKKKSAKIKTTVIVAKKPQKSAPFLIEPVVKTPAPTKKSENDFIEFEEIDEIEFESFSEFDEVTDLEWTPEIDLSVSNSGMSPKTSLLESNLMKALDQVREAFVRHCPKCGGEMKNSFVILGPTRRMMVYQCVLCKFYLPR